MKSATVLLASVDLVGMSSTVRLLQLEGHEVVTAFNGTDLIEVLDRMCNNIDVIITDVSIPGIEVYDVSDFIAMRRDDNVPIIGIAEFPRDEEQLMNAGETFCAVLEKGYSQEELLESLESLLHPNKFIQQVHYSQEEIRARAALLSDTQTVAINRSDLGELSHSQLRNSAHQRLVDQLESE